MPQDRHQLERVKCDMARGVHFCFEIVERVLNLLVGQNDSCHLHIGTTGKAEQRDLGHGLLHAAAESEFWNNAFHHKLSPGERYDLQCLGKMPWGRRATAVRPDSE